MSMLLDVSVTTTTRYHENGVAIPVNVNDVGKYAEVTKRRKVRKYGAEARGFGFKAFILESIINLSRKTRKWLLKHISKSQN